MNLPQMYKDFPVRTLNCVVAASLNIVTLFLTF